MGTSRRAGADRGRAAGADVDRSRHAAAWLRAAAAVATLVTGAVVAAVSWADSGPFTLVLVGVPALAVAPVLLLRARPRAAGIAAWVAAVVVLGWSVLTGLGSGAYFAAPGVVLLVAAIATLPGGAPTPTSTPTSGRLGGGDPRSP
ncbi:hypothetical protein [Cellulomonas cellasea]|uniref:Uncharacterized protein n=1 Tax=Cellulomonas cellasea TaxID=43670 RepID=A0A7W4UF14_9CELL|nr:hypothetical protein [Cellulomonas cellasea]MBB2923007.1 hypothetical protein [Cellulomonas cellasea]